MRDIRVRALAGFMTARALILGDCAATEVPRLQIGRSEIVPSMGLTDDVLQAIARQLGPGQFLVVEGPQTTVPVAERTQILFFYPSQPDLVAWRPCARFAVRAGKVIASTDAVDFANRLIRESGGKGAVVQSLPTVIGSAAYAGRAWACDKLLGTLADAQLRESTGCDPARLGALRDACRDPSWQAMDGGRIRGSVRFLLADGALEEVTIGFRSADGVIESLDTVALSPAGHFIAATANPMLDQWVIDPVPEWRPSRRYQLRFALVALRHDGQQEFDLALALLRDPGVGAHDEGMKLLRHAAGLGNARAARLLDELANLPNRDAPDRERMRLER